MERISDSNDNNDDHPTHFSLLQDILKKEEIKLDWNFKWSMLNDLVRVSENPDHRSFPSSISVSLIGNALYHQFTYSLSWQPEIS